MEKEWGYGVATELKEWGRGCDLKLFDPSRRSNSFRKSKGFADTDVVLLWVGRLVPEKRPDIWLDVLKRLQQDGLPVKGMVVGHGTFETTLSQMKDVVCCGWLSGVALAEAYACADILLFPSDVETFGNVTLESLASGCCCVVESKCGEHLVEHGVNGFTCEAGNLEDFYRATKRIAEDSALRASMSVNARKGSWKFERHMIMQQMAENYKDAIVRHRDPSFCKAYMQSSPEAAGNNFLSLICCNYWLIKTIAEPFLNTSRNVQNLVESTSLCVSQSKAKLNCSPRYADDVEMNTKSRFEDERKGRIITSNTSTAIGNFIYNAAIVLSYILVFIFIYATLYN